MRAEHYRDKSAAEPEAPSAPPRAQLGALRSTHEPPPLRRALVGPVLLSGLAAVVAAAFGGPAALMIAVALVVLVASGWAPIRARGRSVALHANGLLLRTPNGEQRIAFEDVNEVWFDIPMLHSQAGAPLRALRLVDFEGAAYRVPMSVSQSVELAGRILKACSGSLLVEAKDALGEGSALTFGNVRLDRRGIRLGEAERTWTEIRSAIVSHGRIHLYRRLPILAWRTIRLDRIPNPAVFVTIVAMHATTRIDDRLILPLAAEHGAKEGVEHGLGRVLVGGVSLLTGIILTLVSQAVSPERYAIFAGAIVFGLVQLVRGVLLLRATGN